MPDHTVAESVIEEYLAAVAARLVGPRRARFAILDELRDGLREATAANGIRGMSPAAAVRAALEEFGRPEAAASAFAPELAGSQACRTTLIFLFTGPLVGVWWLLLLAPPAWWRQGPLSLLAAIPALPLVVLGCTAGLVVFAATGRLSRWLHPAPRHLLDTTVLIAAACMAGDLVVLALLLGESPTVHTALGGALATIAVTASLTRLGCSIRAVLRCLHTRRAIART